MKKYQLVRFFDNEEYAKDFLAGNISMNYLGAYWGPDLDCLAEEKEREHWETKEIKPEKFGQDDVYEGTVCLLDKETTSFLPGEIRSMCKGNVILRIEAYRYCNLLCMCAVDYDEEVGKIFLPDTEYFKEPFGKYVVVISDTDEFIRRLKRQLENTSYDYIYGRVEYADIIGDESLTELHSPLIESELLTNGLSEALEKGRAIDVFVKDQLLCVQREWRVCVYRDVQEENRYYLPSLGSLEDIAELVETESLNTVLKEQHPGLSYSLIHPDSNIDYEGNISRAAFQKKICADGKYKVLFNMV